MNREIKYRAWDIQYKQMVNIELMFFFSDRIEIDHDKNYGEPKNAEHFNLMQSTGLKDERGKEVFEGDVLEGFGKTWFVQWQNEEARFLLMCKEVTMFKFMDEVNRMGIIGNIYENSNLIK